LPDPVTPFPFLPAVQPRRPTTTAQENEHDPFFVFETARCVTSPQREAKRAISRNAACADAAELANLHAHAVGVRQRAISSYDADNRVDVDGGDPVSGQIQIADRAGSVES
jgi:hypothetical protein